MLFRSANFYFKTERNDDSDKTMYPFLSAKQELNEPERKDKQSTQELYEVLKDELINRMKDKIEPERKDEQSKQDLNEELQHELNKDERSN